MPKCPDGAHYHLDVILLEAEVQEIREFCEAAMNKDGFDIHLKFGDNEPNKNAMASAAVKAALDQILGKCMNIQSRRKSH